MRIGNFDVVRTILVPFKTYSPLVVDADTVYKVMECPQELTDKFFMDNKLHIYINTYYVYNFN